MTAVKSHSTTHVSQTRIPQLGDELMSALTFVTPDTRFSPTGAKYKPALVDINYRATHPLDPWIAPKRLVTHSNNPCLCRQKICFPMRSLLNNSQYVGSLLTALDEVLANNNQ